MRSWTVLAVVFSGLACAACGAEDQKVREETVELDNAPAQDLTRAIDQKDYDQTLWCPPYVGTGCYGKECGPDCEGGSCGECPDGWHCKRFGPERHCVADCEHLCSEFAECGIESIRELGDCDCGVCPLGEECITCWPNNEGPMLPVCCPSCESLCADAGLECDEIHDKCRFFCSDFDNLCDCGTCPEGQSCVYEGLSGPANCCMPNCEDKECGPDGCGGTCGTCPCEGCDPNEISCEGGQCVLLGCEPCNCSHIVECMALCEVPGTDCLQSCLEGESIETQMAFNALMDCMGESNWCYWFDDCLFDPKEKCPTEYYACFPPGHLDCAGIYGCLVSCGEDVECVEECYVEGSLEGLETWDALIDCLDTAGYFDCAEGDDDCLQAAELVCESEFVQCIGCILDDNGECQ